MYRVRPELQLRRVPVFVVLALVAACATPAAGPPLADHAFRELVVALSEPPGTFEHSDNLVSNEPLYAEFARLIRRRGGAYVGVGPEQNFSYIARLSPSIAFIVDIREGNRSLHLLYKALFEMAGDRAAFLSLLFSRPRPGQLSRAASVDDLFAAFDAITPSALMADTTRSAVVSHLANTRRFPLGEHDVEHIDKVLQAFFAAGPAIRYGPSERPGLGWPSYRTLMTTRDLWGNPQSYLASEESFAVVKTLHHANRIIPVVGDFAGDHALRKIADYLRAEGEPLAAFYGSNVEVYLTRTDRRRFCANLESMPYDADTQFIGNRRLQSLPAKLQACARIQPSLPFPKGLAPADSGPGQ
jgi:hypothetical protein